MMPRPLTWLFAVSLLSSVALAAPAPDLGTDEQRAAGKKIYDVNCVQCHGEKGDGNGVAFPHVLPKPRDFTSGKFKIRTTPSGSLPTTDDLKNIISRGMPYTAMPAWPQFNDQQLTNLAYYVKSFSPDFANPERQPEPIKIPSAPSLSDDSIEKGKQIYGELGCARCHGDVGRTDGISAPTLTDDWGHSLRPADLTKRWTFRGGHTREDIFRAFSTGLNGTPMPSFYDALQEEQRWDLANYVYSLSPGDDPDYATVLISTKTDKQLEIGAEGEDPFKDAEPAYFPLFGQIVQPGREFHPPATGIKVRSVYNEDFIAFELSWHDMQAQTTGKNGPEIAVPPAEDEGEAPAAKPAADAGGWGDAEDTAPAPAAKADADPWGEDSGGGAAAPASEFSDAVAIQFPVEKPTTIRKPYFIFGDKGGPVHLWFADLARKDARLYAGHGSDALESLGPRELKVTSSFDKGEWKVVFKRKLRAMGETTFEPGGFMPVAFSVWDGGARERGNKRALTNWWTVYLSPGEKPSGAKEIAKWAVLAFVLEILFIVWARRRAKKSPAPLP